MLWRKSLQEDTLETCRDEDSGPLSSRSGHTDPYHSCRTEAQLLLSPLTAQSREQGALPARCPQLSSRLHPPALGASVTGPVQSGSGWAEQREAFLRSPCLVALGEPSTQRSVFNRLPPIKQVRFRGCRLASHALMRCCGFLYPFYI